MSVDAATARTAAPVPTNNMLADLVGWIKEGDCVVLHAPGHAAQIYHNCVVNKPDDQKGVSGDTKEPSLDGIRVIWFNAANDPDLLLEGEWPYYIKEGGCRECTCSLKDRVTKADGIPHLYRFSCPKLGFS